MNNAHPILVSTQWVEDNLKDPKVRIAEVDYDPRVHYELGHIPGAVLLDWKKDINDPVRRDIFSKEQCQQVLGRYRIFNDTTLVLYGDYNNWFGAFAFWALKYYGFKDVRFMDGGRKKWTDESRPLTKEIRTYPIGNFVASKPDEKIRAYRDLVENSLNKKGVSILDCRSPAEFTGEASSPSEYPNESAQRGGHIPGAINIPWKMAVHEDGSYKPSEELKRLYLSKGVTPDKEVITYCRIGERSSHTWFMLKYILGYPNVRNYDGSWAEWGNMVRSPIEKP